MSKITATQIYSEPYATLADAIAMSPNVPMTGYVLFADHPDNWNPFDPHMLGALREVYTFITQPKRSAREEVTYDSRRYSDLTEMLRRAIRNGERVG